MALGGSETGVGSTSICSKDSTRLLLRRRFLRFVLHAAKAEGAYGPGHETLLLATGPPGMLMRDVVDGLISFIEVLDSPGCSAEARRFGFANLGWQYMTNNRSEQAF